MGVGGSRVTQGGLTWEALRQKRWRTTKTFPNENCRTCPTPTVAIYPLALPPVSARFTHRANCVTLTPDASVLRCELRCSCSCFSERVAQSARPTYARRQLPSSSSAAVASSRCKSWELRCDLSPTTSQPDGMDGVLSPPRRLPPAQSSHSRGWLWTHESPDINETSCSSFGVAILSASLLASLKCNRCYSSAVRAFFASVAFVR